MTFKKIDNERTITHWISGAYKIVVYDYRSNGGLAIKQKTYHAYNKIWDKKLKIFVSGNYIDFDNPDYNTLAEAKNACKQHAILNPQIANNAKQFYTTGE